MNPGGGSGREEPPLDIQIPDDARELDRDLLAYRREQRVQRRRDRLRKLTAPFGGTGTVMPLLASILAVCLVAGAMLSVATFGPSTTPANRGRLSTTAAASQQSVPQTTASASAPPAAVAGTSRSSSASPSGATPSSATPSGASSAGASPSGASPSGAQPSRSANSPAGSPKPTPARHAVSAAP